jgi:hypothetical protein
MDGQCLSAQFPDIAHILIQMAFLRNCHKPGSRHCNCFSPKCTFHQGLVGAAAGDCVLMAPTEGTLQYIGKVEKMWADGAGKVKVRSRWYYRPHEAKGGRRAVSHRVLFLCTLHQRAM